MGQLEITATPLAGLKIIQRRCIEDSRGYFSRLYCAEELREAGFSGAIVQINQTLTRHRGAVRGMHFQNTPYTETKIVSCLRGSVFDVAVDFRHGSPTFLSWYGLVLSAENRKSLLIPEGFAHGFQTMTDDCELLYLHSAPYVPTAEGALNALDPRLSIEWPLPVGEMSERDRLHPNLESDSTGIES